MSLDFLSCLEGFVAVAEYNGFSQAARNLHVATPMLTTQLKRLEELLGRQLFHRTTRHVALTEAGEIYLVRAKKILADIQDAKNEICDLEAKPHGKLTMAVPGSFNSPFFVEHMQQFLKKYPKIQLQVVGEQSPLAVLDGSIDVLVSEMDIKDKQLIKEPLFTFHRSVYAAPSYIKKYGKPESIQDLKNHNCLIAMGVSPNNEWLIGNKKITVQGNYSSTSGINIFYAGLAGLGLIWCTDVVISDEIKKGKLVEIKLEGRPAAIKIYLYYRPTNYGSNVQLIAEHLKKMIFLPSTKGTALK